MWLQELGHQKDDEGQHEQNSHHYAEDTPVALQASQRRAPYEGPIALGCAQGRILRKRKRLNSVNLSTKPSIPKH